MATRALMAFGDIVFQPLNNAFTDYSISKKYRWSEEALLDGGTSLQFTGESPKRITIRGTLYPDLGRMGIFQMLEELENIAKAGMPKNLVNFRGQSLGRFVIDGIEEKHTVIDQFGIPQAIDFNMTLIRYGA